MATFQIKVGDTLPTFSGECLDAAGDPVATLGSTVQFRMRPQITGLRDPLVADAEWEDPEAAVAKYQWQAGDTDVAGLYDCDFVVSWVGGLVESFPNDSYSVVEILAAA